MASDYRNFINLLEGPRLCPFLYIPRSVEHIYVTSVERYWRRKPKHWERNLSHCHFVYHKSHKNRYGTESGQPWWQFGDWPAVCKCPVIFVFPNADVNRLHISRCKQTAYKNMNFSPQSSKIGYNFTLATAVKALLYSLYIWSKTSLLIPWIT
jgi:hypothetical protein